MPKKSKPDAGYAQQPSVAAILSKLRSKLGATIEELAQGREPHTIRAILSRLRTRAGVRVASSDERRGRVYRAEGGL